MCQNTYHSHTILYTHSQGGRLKYVEQKEVYADVAKHSSKIHRASRGSRVVCRPTNTHIHGKNEWVQSVTESLRSTRLPESVLKPALHYRSMAMSQHSELVKLLLAENTTKAVNESGAQADEGVMQSKQNSFQTRELVSLSPISTPPATSASPTTYGNATQDCLSPDLLQIMSSSLSLSPFFSRLESGTPPSNTTSFV